ncbi:MAG: type II toxin-antitoxin system prevent-host-death family antitoxin [Deltaproteobacteria bacterium]|nr:type II toxin-antitoxin system prevent-host-death family antitoxin [Deltaproteobacteria bacterium]
MSRGAREIGVRELRDHLSAVLDAVREGETVIVTDRRVPIARLVPMDAAPVDDALRELSARGLISFAGGRPRGSGRGPGVAASVADAVIEDRR